MIAAEIATARIESIDVRVELVGAPDVTWPDGKRLISERARVITWRPPDSVDGSGSVIYVVVSGRGILANGEIGRRTRQRVFGLVHSGHDPAPSWLVEALNAAGVTW